MLAHVDEEGRIRPGGGSGGQKDEKITTCPTSLQCARDGRLRGSLCDLDLENMTPQHRQTWVKDSSSLSDTLH